MARQIISGLPISMLTTTVNALRNKLKTIWLNLKSKSNPNEVLDHKSVPTEPEICLLICSLFPQDFIIPIEDLVIYGMGLDLFEDVHNLHQARCRVHGLIETINHLIPRHVTKLRHIEDEFNNQCVIMQTPGYNLASSISSRYPLVFGRHETISEKWPSTNRYKDCYGLSLVLKKISEHPTNLVFRELVLLRLKYGEESENLPIEFFQGMEELRVLSLDTTLLSCSLNLPRNLRTLCLKVRKLEDMSWIGDLINLEFLSISTLSSTDIPQEMGQLGNLRLLDLRKMNIAFIPPGVLSRMLKLEELYLPSSFRRWGCKASDCESSEEKNDVDDDEERINVCLSEIVFLSLNTLQICIQNASILPKNSTVFKNLQQFKILVSNNLKYQPFGKGSVNELQLTGEACDIKESGICDLMSRIEDLNLTRVKNLKNVMYELQDYDFPHLKNMIVTECDELEYLVYTATNCSSLGDLRSLHLSMLRNLKEIWHGITRPRFGWFENLRQINIRFCHKLKYVFPMSIARGLRRLTSIEILDCTEMEGIFYIDEVDDNSIVDDVHVNFIRNLHLHSLPKLVGFLIQNDEIHNEDSSNEELVSNSQVSRIRDNGINGHLEKRCAFPFELMDKRLNNLEKLKIAFCDEIEVIFLFKENHSYTMVLNYLKELELYGLKNLIHIWSRIPKNVIAFQRLQVLVLSKCHNSYVLSTRVAQLLIQLKKIQISRCEKMEEIIAKDDGSEIETIVFPMLMALELQHMPKLKTFCGGIYAIGLPLLKSLKLNQCNKMESFSFGSMNTPMLERIEMNGSSYSIIEDLNTTMKRRRNNL